MVILITGKAGAGKTTYAARLEEELVREGLRVARIDADDFRRQRQNKDYTDEGRWRNLKDAAEFAYELEKGGYTVLMSFIAPKKEWRDRMRDMWKQSRVVYIPGGTLWEGTTYETPTEDELNLRIN